MVHVASRNLLRAGNAFAGLPVRYWQAPLSFHRPEKTFEPTLTLAHILYNVGFASMPDIALRITAWRNIYALARPDVLLADYSPTALLAARGGAMRTISMGIGFCVPPNQRPLAKINTALQQHKLPSITALADVFHAMPNAWLATVPELDHYPGRGPAGGCPPKNRETLSRGLLALDDVCLHI